MERLTMSVEEMGKQLGISRPTAYALANSKDFPVLRLGRRKVVPVDGLKRWVEKQSSRQDGE